jgi:NADPH:quinone reductase-like Zn-dependent oxidoreductase
VQVEHAAIGINFVDIYFRTGLYPSPSRPFTAGGEAAGTITKVGKGVSGFGVGDRVAYVSSFGAYAEAANVPERTLVKLPKSIRFEMAAGMMVKGMTAEYLLRRTYKVEKGDTVLVHAAAGGVGLILCQWAKALGATVIGTVGSPDKVRLAKKNGARHVILYREEDVVKRVAQITKGKEVRGRLRRRRQGDLPRLPRLPQALRNVRELRQRLGTRRCLQSRPSGTEGLAIRDTPDPGFLYRSPGRHGLDRQATVQGRRTKAG